MLDTGGLQERLMLVGELDEDVFEAGCKWTNFGHGNAILQELFAEIIEIEMVVNERVDGLPKNGCAANAGKLASETKRAGNFRRRDFHAQGAVRLDVRKFPQRIGRAVSDELAVINVSDVAAALGFIHVVRGDEKSDAMARELEEQIPQLASRDRVDAG